MDAKQREGVWSDGAWQKHLDEMNQKDEAKEAADRAAAEDASKAKEEEPAESEAQPKKEADAEAEKPEVAAEKKDEGVEEQAETPAPETPAPAPLEVKFRGAQRSFDLANEDEKKQVVNLVSKGLDYEALVAERDAHVARDATKMRDNYFRETGILALDPQTQQWQPDPVGVVRWATTVLGADKFRAAASSILGAAPQSGGVDVKEIEALEAEAAKYPDDPVYAPISKMAAALKAQAAMIQSLQSGVDSRLKQYEGRFAGMDSAAKQAAQEAFARSMYQHRDAEIAKVKGLEADDDDREFIMQKATRLEQAAVQNGRPLTPELSKECITAAVKAIAAKRVAVATQRQAAAKEDTQKARPTAKAPPPSASGAKAAPVSAQKKPLTAKDRDALWNETWKETMSNA